MLGYKNCGNCVVTLRIGEINNENRDEIIDYNHAEFRCKDADVLNIEFCSWYETNEKVPTKVENTAIKNKLIYEVDKKVEGDTWDIDINHIFTNGIHYCKNKLDAEFYNMWNRQNTNYTGNVKEYFYNGRLHLNYNLINGIKNGNVIEYYTNGNKSEESNYKNGKRNGECIIYYSNGNIMQKCTYVDGLIQGINISYNDLGNITSEDFYVDGYKLLNNNK